MSTPTEESVTIEPVTTSGIYELRDGRFRRFGWHEGQLFAGPVYASIEELQAAEQAWLNDMERMCTGIALNHGF